MIIIIGITIILFVVVKFLTCYSQHHKIFKLFANNLSANAIETVGSMRPKTLKFLRELGRRLCLVEGPLSSNSTTFCCIAVGKFSLNSWYFVIVPLFFPIFLHCLFFLVLLNLLTYYFKFKKKKIKKKFKLGQAQCDIIEWESKGLSYTVVDKEL